MIDSLTILVTSGAILFVVVRALALDRLLPWFAAPGPKPEEPARADGAGRRQTPSVAQPGHPTKPPWRAR